MTAPYYQDEWVTLYHADCRELLSAFRVDGVVTDPPYGINWSVEGGGKRSNSRARHRRSFAPIVGDDAPFDPAPLLAMGLPTILFGANHYADRLPANSGWIVWDKRVGMASTDQSDCELIWTNLGGAARMFRHVWNGGIRPVEDRSSAKAWGVLHPTQKPISLMRWLVKRCPGEIIFDPYAGSGTTLRAAKDIGKRCVGIEIEERYCEVAAKRCAQEVLELAI